MKTIEQPYSPNGICLLLHHRFRWAHFSYDLRQIISRELVSILIRIWLVSISPIRHCIIKLILLAIRLIKAFHGNESVRIENRSSHSCVIEWNCICHGWSDSIISIFGVNLNEWISSMNPTDNRYGCKYYKLQSNNS